MSKAELYWISRHKMVNLLLEGIKEHNNLNDAYYGKIEIHSGFTCEAELFPLIRILVLSM